MYYKLILFTAYLTFVLVSTGCQNTNPEIKSPSGNLSVLIQEDSTLLLIVRKGEHDVVEIKSDFNLKDGGIGKPLKIREINRESVDNTWMPVYGERNQINDKYNELKIEIIYPNEKTIALECRVYDEGYAFRYLFDQDQFLNTTIENELTTFSFTENHKVWSSERAQSEITESTIDEIKGEVERPLLINQNDSTWLALGEAALVNYSRTKFTRSENEEYGISTKLSGPVDLQKAGFQTPWRYIMVGNTEGDLLENNYFIQNLNEPNKIEDTSWIKPGKVIREVTLTTKGGMACIDFADRHNLQYVEFDAGWYGNEYDDISDASTITVDPNRSPGPLDLKKIISYANQKDIGIILYINRRAMEKQLDEVLPIYKSWGIKGLKYGFVNVGSQEWTIWLHEAVRKAADHQLMVDIHDEYRPTGFSRTYPNLMTQEGIRGDEESPSTEHTLKTLFTRMLAGAGDNTNCYYAPRVSEKMGGKAAQMAKSIMIYSPWQFLYWYDRPEGSPSRKGGAGKVTDFIGETEDLTFYDKLPTVWDEVKVLEAKIGEYATMARRKGNKWFVGTLAASEPREVTVSLAFLGKGKYSSKLYYQTKRDLIENKVSIKSGILDQNSEFIVNLEDNSGAALILEPID